MRRYLRLYAYFLRFSFSRAMEFRIDFFFRIGMDVLWNITHITFFTVLFLHTKMLGDLTLDQVWVFMGALFVSDAIHMTVFSNNMWWFPLLVNRGDLDYYLVRPVSTLFFLSVRDFAANSFLNLLIAIGILTYALLRYPGPLTAGSILVFLTFLLAGSFLHYVTHMLFTIPVFWLQSPGGIREVYWSVSSTMGRPHRIYTGWVRRILVSILPFAFMVSFPTEALFSGASLTLILHGLAVLGTATALMLVVWQWGLRSYASASS